MKQMTARSKPRSSEGQEECRQRPGERLHWHKRRAGRKSRRLKVIDFNLNSNDPQRSNE
jgi:hypothetical protein